MKQQPSRPARGTGAAPDHTTRIVDRSLRRGIRSDRVRGLFDRATDAGWSAKELGSGHLGLFAPDGRTRLTISMTAKGDGHGWLNVRADAKRAGLDVAGL